MLARREAGQNSETKYIEKYTDNVAYTGENIIKIKYILIKYVLTKYIKTKHFMAKIIMK